MGLLCPRRICEGGGVLRMPMPEKVLRVVFESSQKRFEHHIRLEHVLPSAAGHDSDDDDFMPIPNTRSSSHIDKSKDVGPRKTRQTRAGLSTGACTEARQRKKRATSRSSIVNVRCNPRDVIFTTNLLNPQQYAAIKADGFGHLLRMKIDAIENKNLLTWLLDHTDPDRMLIRIGAGKVLPVTPQIISMVLGLPIRGENFKQYSWKEGFYFPAVVTPLVQLTSRGQWITNCSELLTSPRLYSMISR
ncbi:uncharacterized protein [Miscanthus floridulus]|uniref:uncharacterized protein n=1 Tax=Miscanthus floridulus TaxID=154761 RepID=UPI00345757F5